MYVLASILALSRRMMDIKSEAFCTLCKERCKGRRRKEKIRSKESWWCKR